MDERLKLHYQNCKREMAQCRTIAEMNEVAARYRRVQSTAPEGETLTDAAARLLKRPRMGGHLGPVYGPIFEKIGAREVIKDWGLGVGGAMSGVVENVRRVR